MSIQPARAVKRVVLYGRASHDRRKLGRSVDSQLAECRMWCEREGWQVAAEHRDDGVSASSFARRTARRAGWQQVMDLVAAGEVDALVAWEISRTTRDRAVWAALMAICQEQRILIGVGGRLHDPNDADDAFVLDLQAALGFRESSKTSERVQKDVTALARKGLPHGKIPYGYRREYDPATGALLRQLPDEKTAPIVREMARRAAAGEPLNRIAIDLNKRGVLTPTGRPWELSRVRQIIINPTVAGLRVFRGEVLPDVTAAWEPLIPPDDFWALHAKLTDPRRRTYSDGSVKHLLANIAQCGVCGAKCRRIKNRGTPSYACAKGHCVARAQWLVDQWVTDHVVARLEREDAWDLLRDDDDEAVALARDEVKGLRARLDGFYDAAAEGKLTPTALARIEAKLLPQIEAADKRSRSQAKSTLVAEMIGPRARERWDAFSVPQRREVVRTLLTPVINKSSPSRKRDFESIKIRWHGEE